MSPVSTANTCPSKANHLSVTEVVKPGTTPGTSRILPVLADGKFDQGSVCRLCIQRAAYVSLSPCPSSSHKVSCPPLQKNIHKSICPSVPLKSTQANRIITGTNTPRHPVTLRKWFTAYCYFKVAHLYQLNKTVFLLPLPSSINNYLNILIISPSLRKNISAYNGPLNP